MRVPGSRLAVLSRAAARRHGNGGDRPFFAENITGVSAAAESTTQASMQTRTAVDELSRMAADLRTSVGRFSY